MSIEVFDLIRDQSLCLGYRQIYCCTIFYGKWVSWHKSPVWHLVSLIWFFISFILFSYRHFIKGIKNRIIKAGKLVSCKVLLEWLSSVLNMLWWSLKTAAGKLVSQCVRHCILIKLRTKWHIKTKLTMINVRLFRDSKTEDPEHFTPYL